MDLYVYHPAHGFSDDDFVYVSWLDDNFFIAGTGETGGGDSYRLAFIASGTEFVQFTTSIFEGYVRLVDDPAGGSAIITGLDHLEGELVTLVSGGGVVTTQTVSGGEIVAPEILTDYTVGLPYTFKVRTPRLELPAQPTMQSRIKRINETVVRYIRTKGGKAGQEYGNNTYLSEMGAVFSNDSKDATISTKGGFTSDAYETVISDTPFPMTVLAIITSFEVEEKR